MIAQVVTVTTDYLFWYLQQGLPGQSTLPLEKASQVPPIDCLYLNLVLLVLQS